MKRFIIAIMLVLLCALSVYAGGKKDTSSSSSSTVSSTTTKTTSTTVKTDDKAVSTTTTTQGRSLTEEEIALHKAAGELSCDYSKVTVIEGQMPSVETIRTEAAAVNSKTIDKVTDYELTDKIAASDAMTMPSGTIYTKYSVTDDIKDKALLTHEIEHAAQFQNGNAGTVFDTIVNETKKGDPYNTPGTLENKAQKVQDKAESILRGNKE